MDSGEKQVLAATARKLAFWAALILFGIMAGRSLRPTPPKGPSKTEVALTAERDSIRRVLVETEAMMAGANAQVETVTVLKAGLDKQRAERHIQAAALQADSVVVGDSTHWYRQRADTLWKLYATCSVEVDSLDGAVDRMLGAYRECAHANDIREARLVKAEGSLNIAVARIGQLERMPHSRWRLGVTAGAVGGFDQTGPWYGPGVAAGATLKVRLPLVGVNVGLTAGGVAGLDLLGRARVGVGAGAGLSVAF